MDIDKIYPKQIHVKLDMSAEEIEQLLDFLDNAVVDYGGKGEKIRKAGEYVVKEFFPKLEQLSQQIKGIEV